MITIFIQEIDLQRIRCSAKNPYDPLEFENDEFAIR